MTAQQSPEHCTWEGIRTRFAEGLLTNIEKTIRRELALIETLRRTLFPDCLLDRPLCPIAGILCQGRGSAANFAVCYMLGITSIDANINDLLFERIVSQ